MTAAAGPTALAAAAAGATSVFSTCTLPVVPVLVAGAGFRDGRRPAALAGALALSFFVMGLVNSLWGELLVGRTRTLEVAGTSTIVLVGLAGLGAEATAHRRRAWLAGLGAGWPGGAVLGLALGLVWVPCIGPVLSEILGAAGTAGHLSRGAFLLAAYSTGLALPLLAVAFASHLAQRGLAASPARTRALRWGAAGMLCAFGLYQILHGNLAY